MPRRSRPVVNYHDQRFMQISEAHCGPAIIKMMLSNQGIEVTQDQVAEAGGATSLIAMHGMRVDQLARAVQVLAPHMRFYYKDQSTIEELARIVRVYSYPVGVEWQGVFEDKAAAALDRGNTGWVKQLSFDQLDALGLLPDSETEDNDYGHYSLVTQVDRRRRLLMVVDPYKEFYAQSRIFDFEVFERRWYDYNEVTDAASGEAVLVRDERLMFLVARRAAQFPLRMGLRAFA